MKNYIYILFVLTIYNLSKAQDTTQILTINEVVISANKVEENSKFVAQQIKSINRKQIELWNTPSTADLIAQSGNLMVQKSQQGGGSPMIRGFEASRVLLMIDGVRLNNLIYRAGHLQNVITVDQNVLDRVEIVYGPSSTVYGSDALGGTIHLLTKNPKVSTSEKYEISGNEFIRYATANHEKTVHADLNIGFKKFASLSSFTYSKFDDLKMGKNPQALDTVWGLRKYVLARYENRDTFVYNSDPYRQSSSGFEQYDFLQKFLFQQNENTSHIVNFQYSNSSNIPRYDRLTDMKGNTFASAEWYYGPQKRFLASYIFNKTNMSGFFNSMNVNINFQNVEESRYNRNFNAEFRNQRIEQVKVLGGTLDFRHTNENHDLRFGLDGQYNTVLSNATKFSVIKNTEAPQSTRYPSGDNLMSTVALFFTHTWKINDKLTLNDGLRLAQINLKSTFTDKTFYNFPYDEAKQNEFGWSGNVGLIYAPMEDFKVSALVSSGFRVPNIDDISKVFESVKGRVIIPNESLKPEKTYNAEISIVKSFNKRFTLEGTFYYTAFRDAIVADKFTFNGKDSIVFDGVNSAVYANQNKNKATVYGFYLGTKFQIINGLTGSISYNYTKGTLQNFDGTEVPLDHIPPTFGRIGLQYKKKKWNVELFSNFSGWKRIEDYNPNGEDNQVYATADGMPSWWTLNLKLGYQVLKSLQLQAGMDNILDINYRVFSSGIHAPGRNIFLTARYQF